MLENMSLQVMQAVVKMVKIHETFRKLMGKHRKCILLMYYQQHIPSEEHIKRLAEIASDYDIVIARSKDAAINNAPRAEIIMGNRYLHDCVDCAVNLKWVQSTSGGMDQLPITELQKRRVLLSRATLSSSHIARHAHTLAWSLVRRIPLTISQQTNREWFQVNDTDFLPSPKTALIVGFGNIGKEIARLLKNDGMVVWAVKRMRDESSEKLCDKLFDIYSWRDMLPKVDLCFLALPSTKETKGFFDESALRALPGHAVIVNVGRGDTLDEAALFKLLREGRIGGAGLDVLSKVPGKADTVAWNTPNMIITPHISAHWPDRAGRLERFFEHQLSRYVKNEVVENTIDYKDL